MQYKYKTVVRTRAYYCTVVVSCVGIRVSISCYASPPLPSWIAIPNTTTFTISAPLHSFGFAGNVSVLYHHYALRTTPTPTPTPVQFERSSASDRWFGALLCLFVFKLDV